MAKIYKDKTPASAETALASKHYWFYPQTKEYYVCVKCLEGECKLKTYMADPKYPNMSQEDWRNKERREYFSKTVNSMIIQNKDAELEEILKKAEEIVNRAFKLYG